MSKEVKDMESNFLGGSLYINKVSISKEIPSGNYLSKLLVIRSLIDKGGVSFTKNITFIVGENGVGKSTLIEGIAVAMGFNPDLMETDCIL